MKNNLEETKDFVICTIESLNILKSPTFKQDYKLGEKSAFILAHKGFHLKRRDLQLPMCSLT